MEQARIKPNNERGANALRGYNKKDNKTFQENLAYRTVVREKFEGEDLIITIKNKAVAKLMRAEDFIEAVHFDMARNGAEREDYEVEIDGKKYN